MYELDIDYTSDVLFNVQNGDVMAPLQMFSSLKWLLEAGCALKHHAILCVERLCLSVLESWSILSS